MDLLAQNFQNIKDQLPAHVKLVAVSKTHSTEKIQELYDLGQRVFGENKVQELLEKQPQLPKDIQWHLIGHLQTNKVKYIIPFVDTIQSVHSEKLLREISRLAEKEGRTVKVLLQVKIAEEESKYGLSFSEAKNIVEDYQNNRFPFTELDGLMGMATFTDNREQVQQEFLALKKLFDEISETVPLETLSMGMSDDFLTAIACGSNSVRVGSAIFGSRQYL